MNEKYSKIYSAQGYDKLRVTGKIHTFFEEQKHYLPSTLDRLTITELNMLFDKVSEKNFHLQAQKREFIYKSKKSIATLTNTLLVQRPIITSKELTIGFLRSISELYNNEEKGKPLINPQPFHDEVFEAKKVYQGKRIDMQTNLDKETSIQEIKYLYDSKKELIEPIEKNDIAFYKNFPLASKYVHKIYLKNDF